MQRFQSSLLNLKETRQFARHFTNDWIKKRIVKHKPVILLFEGSLGAGKTQVIKWIAKELGLKTRLTSPTFILWQIYKFRLKDKKQGIASGPAEVFNFHHLDLYRLSNPKDIFRLGLNQSLRKKNNLFAIEWGERIKKFIVEPYVLLKIESVGKKRRKITIIKSRGPKSQK